MTGKKREKNKKLRDYQVGLVACAIIIVGGIFYSTYQINLLKAEKNSLQNQINDLTTEKTNLQNRYNSLNASYNELNDIVNLRKTIVLEKDKTVNIQMNKYTTLSYSTPYAGYIRVEFAATSGVSFGVGSSFTGGWYASYPPTGTVAGGSFTMPVLQGTTNLYITNPSAWSGATVTLTITYVY